METVESLQKRIEVLNEIVDNARSECDVRFDNERDACVRELEFLVETHKDDEAPCDEHEADDTYLAGLQHALDVIKARRDPSCRCISEMAHGTMIGEFIDTMVELRLKDRMVLTDDTVYVLCEDLDQTLRSRPWPTGEVVLTKEEAKKWEATSEYARIFIETKVVKK